MDVVLDANVLIDLLLKFRPRHDDAKAMVSGLLHSGAELYAPAHAQLELLSAVMQEWDQDPRKVVTQALHRPGAWPIQLVAINKKFLDHHYVSLMPRLRAGDLPYALLSICDGMILVTEDGALRKETNRCGGVAKSISEMLRSYSE